MSTDPSSGRGGEQAADNTKNFFKKAGVRQTCIIIPNHLSKPALQDFSESLRKDINSFADNMVGQGSGTHSNTADRDREHTTGHVEPTGHTEPAVHNAPTGHGGSTTGGPLAGSHREHQGAGGNVTGAHTSSGIHPDAEKAGSGIMNALDRAGEKMDEKRGTGHTNTTQY